MQPKSDTTTGTWECKDNSSDTTTLIIADKKIIAECHSGHNPAWPTRDERRANAALIIKAVNFYQTITRLKNA